MADFTLRCGSAAPAILAALTLPPTAPAAVPAGFTETLLASGLQRPVPLAFLPDGRLLIGEQYTGNILIYANGSVLGAPYATVAPVYTGNNESGLLGLCVDPSFSTNGYVYAFVTQTASVQRVWRYATSGNAGTNPAIVVDNLPTRGVNHNGGGIGFGPDGKLYIVVGENADAPAAQDTSSLRGKVLRANADGTVPSDNPFGNLVWSYGHRHPFRLTFQPGSGRLYASENGPSTDDEINLIVRGGNYGWPTVAGVAGDPAFRDPLLAITPTSAITDLLFYQGTTMPFAGQLFFVEYKSNRIRRLTLSADGTQVTSGPTDFATVNQPVDIEEGLDGALYYATLAGNLYRAQSSGAANQAPTASFTAAPTSGPPPLAVNVDASASIDVDGSIASFAWAWGDGTAAGSGATASHTYAAAGTFTLTLTVIDNGGAAGTATRGITVSPVGNTPPSAHIESATPASGPVPLVVGFAGHGHDSAGEILSHRWDFGDGAAPVTFAGNAPDANTTPQHTYAVAGAYPCTLTVTDVSGVSATHTVTITASAGGAVDTDGDGLTDADEAARGTNPAVADTDADGMSDGREVTAGFNPLAADQDGNARGDGLDDWDGDGTTNQAELAAGMPAGTAPPAPSPASGGGGGGGGCFTCPARASAPREQASIDDELRG